ncbi:hypothetical protein GQ457_15G017450 [Hibiscus cannabinus]
MSTLVSFLLVGLILTFSFSTYFLVKRRTDNVEVVEIESQLPQMENIDIETQVPKINLEAPTKNDRPYEEYKIPKRVQAPRFVNFFIVLKGKIEYVFK